MKVSVKSPGGATPAHDGVRPAAYMVNAACRKKYRMAAEFSEMQEARGRDTPRQAPSSPTQARRPARQRGPTQARAFTGPRAVSTRSGTKR